MSNSLRINSIIPQNEFIERSLDFKSLIEKLSIELWKQKKDTTIIHPI
jgi:hypothetical protein